MIDSKYKIGDKVRWNGYPCEVLGVQNYHPHKRSNVDDVHYSLKMVINGVVWSNNQYDTPISETELQPI